MQDHRPRAPAPDDAQFQIDIDTLPTALLLFDYQATVIHANPPARHLFNHAPNAPLPRSGGEFIRCPNHLLNQRACGHTAFCCQCLLLHGLRSVLTETSPTDSLTGECMLPGESGPPQWIRFTCTPMMINERRGALLALEDITQQRRTERNYQILFEQMLNAFAVHEIICDAHGIPVDYRFLAVNPAFERMTGLSAAEVVGQTVLTILPATEPHWISTYGQVALSGAPVRFENYSQELDKHFSVLAFQAAPGQFACLFDDITARHHSEKRLQESEEHLHLVLEGADLASWDWHIPSGALTFNDIWPALLGYSRNEIEPHIHTKKYHLNLPWSSRKRSTSFAPRCRRPSSSANGLLRRPNSFSPTPTRYIRSC